MNQRPLRLRTQLSFAMILSAVITLFVFISGMLVFYIYLEVSWVEGLDKASRKNLERSEEHTSELQSRSDLVCRLLLEKKK